MSYSLSSSLLVSSLTSYSSLCILQLPGVSVTLRAVQTMSQSSPSYMPRPTHYRPRRRRPHCHPPHSRHTHHVVSYLPTFLCFQHAEQCYVRQNSITACDDHGDGCDAGCFCWKREVCSSIYRCTYRRYKEWNWTESLCQEPAACLRMRPEYLLRCSVP